MQIFIPLCLIFVICQMEIPEVQLTYGCGDDQMIYLYSKGLEAVSTDSILSSPISFQTITQLFKQSYWRDIVFILAMNEDWWDGNCSPKSKAVGCERCGEQVLGNMSGTDVYEPV